MSEEPLSPGWARTTLNAFGELFCGQSLPATKVNRDGIGTPYVTGPEQWDGQTDFLRKLTWSGEIPPKLWVNFYIKVLSKHATDSSPKLKVTFEASPVSGTSKEKFEETRTALKELGLGGGELKSE